MLLVTILSIGSVWGRIDECVEGFKRLKGDNPGKLAQMVYYSGRDVNDFGDFYACDQLSGTRYVTMMVRLELLTIGLGICGPKECEASDYESRAKALFDFLFDNYPKTQEYLKSNPVTVKDTKEYNNRSLDSGAIFTIIFLFTLLSTIIAGTITDILNPQSPEKQLKGYKSILVCFSIITNFKKLTTLPQHSDNLQVFNGVKVIGMLWICEGHNYTYSFNSPSVNPGRALDLLKEFWSRLSFTPIYIVDLFFIMGGFLVTFLTVGELRKRRGKMNWVMFVVHRFLRICPIYFFVLMIFINLVKYLGSSAMWPMFWDKYEESCGYWWANVLFISNFEPSDMYSCMGWSWYIPNDMQFYVITPIILILYCKNKMYGYGILLVLSISSIIGMIIQASVNDYNPGIVHGTMKMDQFIHFYQRPYNRIGAYLIGMAYGFAYRGYIDSKQKIEQKEVELQGSGPETGLISNKKLDKITHYEVITIELPKKRLIRWGFFITGLIFIFGILFIPYNFENNDPDYWSKGSKSVYVAVEHFIFGIGFVLCMMPMIEGYGGHVKNFLANKYFSVAAKISFSFYLIHPIVILYHGFNRPESHYISHFNYWFALPSTIIFTTLFATLATLCVEGPMLALEKIIFRR